MHHVRIDESDYLCFRPGELRLVVRRRGSVVELQARDRDTALALHALSTGAVRAANGNAIELRIRLEDRSAAEQSLRHAGSAGP